MRLFSFKKLFCFLLLCVCLPKTIYYWQITFSNPPKIWYFCLCCLKILSSGNGKVQNTVTINCNQFWRNLIWNWERVCVCVCVFDLIWNVKTIIVVVAVVVVVVPSNCSIVFIFKVFFGLPRQYSRKNLIYFQIVHFQLSFAFLNLCTRANR